MMVLKEGLQPILLEWAFCPNFCKGGGGMEAAGLERFKREGDVSVISQRGDISMLPIAALICVRWHQTDAGVKRYYY